MDLIAFVDNLTPLLVGKAVEGIENITNSTLGKVSAWLREKRNKIVPAKTEAIMLVGRKKIRNADFMMENRKIINKN